MKVLFVLAVALICAVSVYAFTEEECQDTFVNWMHEHERIYSSDEFQSKYEAFKYNMYYVQEWNAQNNETILGLNNMADLTLEEYRSIYLGTHIEVDPSELNYEPSGPLADTVNWANKGAVTGVKNQGQCGSCWSFSTTGAVEGAYFIKNGKLVSSSEQQLVDCSKSYGNNGCNGGLMDNAFKYIIANHGLDTESSYPYTAKDGSCHFVAANVGTTITSYKDVARGSEAALVTAINGQPVAVAIDASHNSFQLYKSGVYYEPACSASRLDHGVLAVGYGTTGSSDYFVVKNSWGASWGSSGYIQMARNRSNNCGIATQASYAIA